MQVVCYKEWEKRKHALSLSLQAEMADGSVGLEGQRTIVLHSSRAELNRTTAKRSRKRISSSACYGAEKQEGSLFSIINLNITSKAGCKDSRHIMLNTSSFYRCQQLATMSYHFVHRYWKALYQRILLFDHLSLLICIFLSLPTKNISPFDFTSLPSFEHQEMQSCLTKLQVEWNSKRNKEHLSKLQVNNSAGPEALPFIQRGIIDKEH